MAQAELLSTVPATQQQVVFLMRGVRGTVELEVTPGVTHSSFEALNDTYVFLTLIVLLHP